jgi:hypothetical protein
VGDAENVTLVCAASKCILEIFDKNRTNLLLYCSCRTVSTCVMTAPISSQVDEEGLVDTLRKFLTEGLLLRVHFVLQRVASPYEYGSY